MTTGSVLHLNETDTPESVVVPFGKVIVPLKVWQAQREQLQGRAEIGVWLNSDERAEDLRDDLQTLRRDRGELPQVRRRTRLFHRASFARPPRLSRELRAIGDVLRDQLFYMRRVGFDAFEPRADRDIHEALKGVSDFSVCYQDRQTRQLPLFRRVSARGEI